MKKKQAIRALGIGFLTGALLLSGCESLPESDSVIFWTSWEEDSKIGQVIQVAVEDYEESTGVDVEVVYNGEKNQKEILIDALNRGEQIDVFDIDMDFMRNQINDKHTLDVDKLQDLEDFTKEDLYEDTAYSGLMEKSRDICQGELKMIPYVPKMVAFFYNKEMFQEAGIYEEPTTWDEFIDVCLDLELKGYTPITTDDAYIDCLLGTHLGRLAGEDYVRDLVNQESWEDPVFVQMAEDYQALAEYGAFSDQVETNIYPQGQKEFEAGDAAMYLNGTWLKNEISGVDLGCFAYPEVTDGATDTSTSTDTNYIGGAGLCINKYSSKTKEAYELIRLLTKGYYDQVMAEYADVIPVDTENAWPQSSVNFRKTFESTTTSTRWAFGATSNTEKNKVLKASFTKLISGEYNSQEFIDSLY